MSVKRSKTSLGTIQESNVPGSLSRLPPRPASQLASVSGNSSKVEDYMPVPASAIFAWEKEAQPRTDLYSRAKQKHKRRQAMMQAPAPGKEVSNVAETVLNLAQEANDLKDVADMKQRTRDQLQTEFDRLATAENKVLQDQTNAKQHFDKLRVKFDVTQQRLLDIQFHQKCLTEASERLQAANRAMKLRIEGARTESDSAQRKLNQTRQMSQKILKISRESQADLEAIRSALCDEADEWQEQLDKRHQILEQLRESNRKKQEELDVANEQENDIPSDGDESVEVEKDIEMERLMIRRAPLKDQLQWDKEQENPIASAMERLEELAGVTGPDALIEKYTTSIDRSKQLHQLSGDLSERVARLQADLDLQSQELASSRLGVLDADNEGSHETSVSEMQTRQARAAQRVEAVEEQVRKSEKLFVSVRTWADLMADRLDLPSIAPDNQQTLDDWCTTVFAAVEERVAVVTEQLDNLGVDIAELYSKPPQVTSLRELQSRRAEKAEEEHKLMENDQVGISPSVAFGDQEVKVLARGLSEPVKIDELPSGQLAELERKPELESQTKGDTEDLSQNQQEPPKEAEQGEKADEAISEEKDGDKTMEPKATASPVEQVEGMGDDTFKPVETEGFGVTTATGLGDQTGQNGDFAVSSLTRAVSDTQAIQSSLEQTKKALGASPARFDSRIGLVVPSSPRGIPVWSLPEKRVLKPRRSAQAPSPTHSDSDQSGPEDLPSDEESALDVLFADDGTRNTSLKGMMPAGPSKAQQSRMQEFLDAVPKQPPSATYRNPMERAIP